MIMPLLAYGILALHLQFTKNLVKVLNLKEIDICTVHHAGGESESGVYLIDLYLPLKVIIKGLRVIEGQTGNKNVDVLIGMGYKFVILLLQIVTKKRHFHFEYPH